MTTAVGTRLLPTGGFGKLPTQGDFIRAWPGGRDTLELRALDAWISTGLHQAGRVLGADFAARYDAQLFHRLVYRADNSGQTIVGVIRAAQDAVLRRFPFLAFALLPTREVDREPRLLPALGDALFAALEDTIVEVAGLGRTQDILDRLLRPLPMPVLDADHEDRYRIFLEEVEVGDLGSPGFDEHGGPALIDRLCSVLEEGPQDPRLFPFALELPLSQPPFSRPLEIRFWLDLCHRLLPRRPTLSLFWRAGTVVPGAEAPGDAGDAGAGAAASADHAPPRDALLVSFRQPSGLLWPALLLPGQACQGLWRPGWGEAPPAGFSRRAGIRSRAPRFAADTALQRLLLELEGGEGALIPARIVA